MTLPNEIESTPLQPLLDRAVIVLSAPTQVLSAQDGNVGNAPIDGIYHGDVRQVRSMTLDCTDSPVEWISTVPEGPTRVTFGGLLRAMDPTSPDPRVRLLRDRRVSDGLVEETWTLTSKLDAPLTTEVVVRVVPDFAGLQVIKSGRSEPAPFNATIADDTVSVAGEDQWFSLTAPDAGIAMEDGAIELRWLVWLPAAGTISGGFSIALHDIHLVVQGAREPWLPAHAEHGNASDSRVQRWLGTALPDLEALRLSLPEHPEDTFFAAGAPWFFTLFGRDSLWAARLALSADIDIAVSTLRVLAALQGTDTDPVAAEEPGKILHELRSTTLRFPDQNLELPPKYYGSVDSTPLWVCLLGDVWRAGTDADLLRPFLPALRRALRWIVTWGDTDGDGFLDYIDETGRGLANQGWKDSGDSIQWRDGRLAEGPIALCEVQAYAYEAAIVAADILDDLDSDNDTPVDLQPDALRRWAATLRENFANSFWVHTPEGRYPAIALDRAKRPVDTLTSNVGHLLGTGLLDAAEEAQIASLLLNPTMLSGYGIRTMSTAAAGYWPLSYHGGSVWTHDTAIIARGLAKAGLMEGARIVADNMLAAAEGFGFRVPELHSGDARTSTAAPTPYPAACRPQAWSAAAAITVRDITSHGPQQTTRTD